MKLKVRWFIHNILRIALPMLSPIIILGILSFAVIQGELNTSIRENNIQMLRQTNQMIENVFSSIDHIGANFDTNAKNQQLLKSALNKQKDAYTKDDYAAITFLGEMLRSFETSLAGAGFAQGSPAYGNPETYVVSGNDLKLSWQYIDQGA